MKATEVIIINNPAKLMGMTDKEYKAWFDADIQNWCQEHDGLECYFHNDNEQPQAICPTKHHYHCEQCNKLTQIG